MNDAGWPFCDRWGDPRQVTRDDVRRVVANWTEYGGLVFDQKAKARPAYGDYDVSETLSVKTGRCLTWICCAMWGGRVKSAPWNQLIEV